MSTKYLVTVVAWRSLSSRTSVSALISSSRFSGAHSRLTRSWRSATAPLKIPEQVPFLSLAPTGELLRTSRCRPTRG